MAQWQSSTFLTRVRYFFCPSLKLFLNSIQLRQEVIYMPQYIEYLIYAITGLVVIVLALVIYLLIKTNLLGRYFANKKFRLIAKYDISPDTGKDTFSLTIFNNSLNDVRVSDFGILYDNENVSYLARFVKLNKIQDEVSLIISARDWIKLLVPVSELEALVKERNKGSLKVKKMVIFAADSLGMNTLGSAKLVKRIIVKDFKMEQAALNATISAEKARIRKEKWDAFMLKVKAVFKKKESKPSEEVLVEPVVKKEPELESPVAPVVEALSEPMKEENGIEKEEAKVEVVPEVKEEKVEVVSEETEIKIEVENEEKK